MNINVFVTLRTLRFHLGVAVYGVTSSIDQLAPSTLAGWSLDASQQVVVIEVRRMDTKSTTDVTCASVVKKKK